MSQEWISQSKAIREFKVTVDDLHANISKVVDGTKAKKFEGSDNGDKVKVAKNPLVPLTLRLLDNPRGYETPMRLYKISQIRELESHLRRFSESLPAPKPKAVKKKVVKKIKSSKSNSLKINPHKGSCDESGHDFEFLSETQEVCRKCGMVVESQTI